MLNKFKNTSETKIAINQPFRLEIDCKSAKKRFEKRPVRATSASRDTRGLFLRGSMASVLAKATGEKHPAVAPRGH